MLLIVTNATLQNGKGVFSTTPIVKAACFVSENKSKNQLYKIANTLLSNITKRLYTVVPLCFNSYG